MGRGGGFWGGVVWPAACCSGQGLAASADRGSGRRRRGAPSCRRGGLRPRKGCARPGPRVAPGAPDLAGHRPRAQQRALSRRPGREPHSCLPLGFSWAWTKGPSSREDARRPASRRRVAQTRGDPGFSPCHSDGGPRTGASVARAPMSPGEHSRQGPRRDQRSEPLTDTAAAPGWQLAARCHVTVTGSPVGAARPGAPTPCDPPGSSGTPWDVWSTPCRLEGWRAPRRGGAGPGVPTSHCSDPDQPTRVPPPALARPGSWQRAAHSPRGAPRGPGRTTDCSPHCRGEETGARSWGGASPGVSPAPPSAAPRSELRAELPPAPRPGGALSWGPFSSATCTPEWLPLWETLTLTSLASVSPPPPRAP